MKKLFQNEPIIEINNCRQIKMIGSYKFLEASEHHCTLLYENFKVSIQAKSVFIDVLKEEELLIHVEDLTNVEMIRQVNKYEKLR